MMVGASPASGCSPTESDSLPLRHSLYLPPAHSLARIHSALGHLSATADDTVAAAAHLSAAAFIAATNSE